MHDKTDYYKLIHTYACFRSNKPNLLNHTLIIITVFIQKIHVFEYNKKKTNSMLCIHTHTLWR